MPTSSGRRRGHTAGSVENGILRMCQGFCVNDRFFPSAAGILGGEKVEILFLDFHFFTAHSSSWSLGFLFKFMEVFSGLSGRSRRGSVVGPGFRLGSWSLQFPLLLSFFTPARFPVHDRPVESRNVAMPLSSPAPASSTFWRCAPAPGIVASALRPHAEMIHEF